MSAPDGDTQDLVSSRLGPDGGRHRKLLRRTAELIHSRTGARVDLLLAEAERHAIARQDEAAVDGGDDLSLRSAWTWLWQEMWRLTGFDRVEPWPQEWTHLVLPYRWLRDDEPGAFGTYVPTAAEAALGELLDRELASLLDQVGHPSSLDAPVVVWDHELLEEYSQLSNFVATAAASFAPPLGEILVSGSYLETARPPQGYHAESVAGLLLHERLHLHWPAIWPETRSFISSPLHNAIEEAATVVVENLVHLRVAQTSAELYLGSLEQQIGMGSYSTQAGALLELLYRERGRDPWVEPEWIWSVMSCVCTCPEESELVGWLNEELEVDLPASWWHERFSRPYIETSSTPEGG